VTPAAAIRLVAFDCDGVMFDTAGANRAFYNEILAQLGYPPMTEAQFSYVHMHTVDEALRHLFGEGQALARAYAHRRQMSYLPFLDHMRMEPDLLALLDWLRPGYRTAVATNRTDTMQRVLVRYDLTQRFDMVVTALDVPRPKPYPDGLTRIAAHFRLEPAQLLYIGDSPLDAEAAAAAGTRFVAYRNRALPAQHHITRLGQIRQILDPP
jgi:HAD superfamily hydrolase (TIGR01509 family)